MDFLPLRFGLLRLRQASRSCKLLVSECKLSTQIAAGQVRVLKKPKAALAMVEAFPLAKSVKVCTDESWTLESFSVCAHCPTLEVSFNEGWADAPTISGLSLLQRLRSLKSLHLPTEGLSDASFRQLVATTSLALTMPQQKWEESLAFSPASICLARSLRELSLHNFGGRVFHADLAPLAHQLTKLSLIECPGVTDFTDFDALLDLRFCLSHVGRVGIDFSTLPLQLQSLTVHAPFARIEDSAELTFPPGIALRSLELECEFVSSDALATLPSTLEIFSLSMEDFQSSDLAALSRLGQLRSLTCRGGYSGEPLDMQSTSIFSRLESLTIDGAGWVVVPHSGSRLPRLRHLECCDELFGIVEVLLNMPVLETLALTRKSLHHYDTSRLFLCIFRKPTLREISFDADAADASSVCFGVATAVTCTPEARMCGGNQTRLRSLTMCRYPNPITKRTKI